MLENEEYYTETEIYILNLDPDIIKKVCGALGFSEETLTDSEKYALNKVLATFADKAVIDLLDDYHSGRV